MHPGRLLMMFGVVIVAGCSPGANDTESVTGQAMYRERIAAPPGARLEVSLSDASTDDAAERLITRIVIANVGQPPFAFEVPYKSGDIDPAHRYELSARLLDRERLLFETAEPVAVITAGNPREVELMLRQPAAASDAAPQAGGAAASPVGSLPATFAGVLPCADCPGIDHQLDLREDGTYYLRTRYQDREGGPFDEIGRWVWLPERQQLTLEGARDPALRFEVIDADTLRMLDRAGRPIESDLDYTLERREAFEPIEPELELRGMYRYLADAAIFRECLSGLRLPVATEEDNAALQRAYLEAVDTAGSEVLVEVTGRVVQRVPMDGGEPVATLVPVAFNAVRPGERCGHRDLAGPRWRLASLAGEPVASNAGREAPYLIFDGDGRVAGFDGCNRLNGRYESGGTALTLSEMASTMMACPEGMQQADRFRAALGQAAGYRLAETRLELHDESGALLATFAPETDN